jgi:hypothetical protein
MGDGDLEGEQRDVNDGGYKTNDIIHSYVKELRKEDIARSV